MTSDERRRFLTEGTRTAKVATVRKDGRPHVAAVWFVLDGETVVFTTGEGSVKGHALRRDPRIALCVDDEQPPYAFVVVEGMATTSADLDDLRRWATRIAARYMGEDRADVYGRRNSTPGEIVVRVTPTQIVSENDVSG